MAYQITGEKRSPAITRTRTRRARHLGPPLTLIAHPSTLMPHTCFNLARRVSSLAQLPAISTIPTLVTTCPPAIAPPLVSDQPQLVNTYLAAYQITGEERYARVARGILDYLRRDMTAPGGGLCSAEDADSFDVEEGKKKEGSFYLWK